MIIKFYGLYDSVSKVITRIFEAKNDEDCERACHYIVRDPHFDPIQGKDMICEHLYDVDLTTGFIVNSDVHVICSLTNAMALFEEEKLVKAKGIDALKVGGNVDGKN